MGSVRSRGETPHPIGQEAQEVVLQEVFRLRQEPGRAMGGKASLSLENGHRWCFEWIDPNGDVLGSGK